MTVETPLKLLSDVVAAVGLKAVAARTGYSPSAICHVQRGTYRGNGAKVLEAVRAAFDESLVPCPVLGDISYSRCIEEKNRPFAATNPLRVKLAKTCRNCGRMEENKMGRVE
jgi:hypothetical protein